MAPLPVVIPLIVAAVLAGVGSHLPRRVLDLTALITSAGVVAISVLLANASVHHVIVYWFGNWQPTAHSHFPIGICFMIDPIGAGLAAFTSVLVFAAFTFSWSYFESAKALYHILMLVFLAAMCGLCLSGDLFNMFVWFELMTAAGVALCGYKSEEGHSMQGALNFAVLNTVGAFLSLSGVALVYAFTGSLNLVEVGVTLAQHRLSSEFLCVAFLFILSGFLVKAAVFPFHFWLADAHAVAPTPVCVIFSGVMVELGVYAAARIYWVVFSQASAPSAAAVRTLFLIVGSCTAVLGALFCFGQRHFKRLLAFSTISHVGVMTLGFAVLDPAGLAGTTLYLIGHGLVKAALFIGAGIVLHRCGSVDEFDLRGRCRALAPIGAMVVLGAIGLAGLPPFATSFGEKTIEMAAHHAHQGWIAAVLIIAEIFTGAAVLRFAARVFVGWGKGRELPLHGAPHIHTDRETTGQHSRVPVFMWVPMLALLGGACVISIPSTVRSGIGRQLQRFETPAIYQDSVLLARSTEPQYPEPETAPLDFGLENAGVLVGMILLAGLALAAGSDEFRAEDPAARTWLGIQTIFRRLQSGRVGDYVAWFTIGIAVYGAILVLLR
ncbi:MAG TPA: complex I subunit 5 family protein [Candidatus Acidoferrales bacterium]|nr:complex I subunit 5 family protein [Candidatus Acidoferrales bacterium]